MPFSKDKLHQRMTRFTSFLSDQGLPCHSLDWGGNGQHRYLVCSASELALVTFTYQGGVQLIAPAGRVKELLLVWVAQEGCPCYESSTPGELAKLELYHTLLKLPDTAHAPGAFPPPGALQLMPQDNPLVELAELLGYTVYLLPAASSRYAVSTGQVLAAQGDHLPAVLAQLLAGQSVDGLAESSPPYPGKVYLPRDARYPLAYLRQQTTGMTQQTLADLAGLDVHIVCRIEKERQKPEFLHRYLGAARRIIAALNEGREQQGLLLIQLWNIDGMQQELDEEEV